MYSSHNPNLSFTSVASGFANTAGTVTTITTGVAVPAGSLVAVTCQINAAKASVGTITLTGSAGGFGTQTWANFQANGTASACQSLLVFKIVTDMPAGTTLTATRSVTWANAEIRMILCTGCNRLASFASIETTLNAGFIGQLNITYQSGISQGNVSILHYSKSSVNITLAVSDSQQAVAGVGGGGYPNYAGGNRPSVSTISIASNLLSTQNPHGLNIGESIVPRTTTNGLIAGTRYFLIADGFTTTAFKLSLTANGTAVTLTDGTVTVIHDVGYQPIAVQGGSGTVNGAAGTGFRYVVTATVYPLIGSNVSQTFLWQNGPTVSQTWMATTYRLIP